MHELRHQLHKDWLTQASQYNLQGLWGASHTVFHDIGHIRKNKQTEKHFPCWDISHAEVLHHAGNKKAVFKQTKTSR